jgi:hypothetical protein
MEPMYSMHEVECRRGPTEGYRTKASESHYILESRKVARFSNICTKHLVNTHEFKTRTCFCA